ncbi:6-phosphogluconolactonase [Magnetococcus marinus MC-1]|uniref:6-phosphogluconolactonase n=1 Tax=Magnetococcus marinus (strain ATCC BAA-1437 / JCM 17883 / MC-1) TaxID=156889 RepID=A0LDZ7_MAGMM|nr:6-phosphogluconolactonase [Magnetococcus marinus]ABK46190.1 6-phosphogluconolactonase [Magnetococcus marinus MC-1]
MSLPTCLSERHFPSEEQSIATLAETVVMRLQRGIQQRGEAGLIVPGGRSPRGLFQQLCHMELPWEKVTVTLTDERLVSPDAPESNIRQLRQLFLRQGAAKAKLLPLLPAICDPTQAAKQACTQLQQFPWPADVTLLGFGSEDHLASLFPGDAQPLSFPEHIRCVATRSPTPPRARISLTPATLLDSRWIGVLINSHAKLDRFELAKQDGPPSAMPLRTILHQDRIPVTAWIHCDPQTHPYGCKKTHVHQ